MFLCIEISILSVFSFYIIFSFCFIFYSSHFDIQRFLFISLFLLSFFDSFIHLCSRFFLFTYSNLKSSFCHFTDICFKENVFKTNLWTSWHRCYRHIKKSCTLCKIIIVDNVPISKPPEQYFFHVVLFNLPISFHSIW